MAKKDFITPANNKAFDAIADATTEPAARKDRKTYTDEEAAELMAQYRTSGRKDLKLPRINVAFNPDLYAFIRTMARATGQSYTDFINEVLQQYMDAHQDLYKKALELRNSL